MVTTDRVTAIFADARAIHVVALCLLESGEVRNAAEKAWLATRRASEALILARTGHAPETVLETSIELDKLIQGNDAVETFVGQYYVNQGHLHNECFKMGLCEPISMAVLHIRETADYIQYAEDLADHSESPSP